MSSLPSQAAHRFLLHLHIIPCLLGMALLFALMGPGLGRPPQAQPPGFSPALVTVHIYDTVIFLNLSQPAVSYAVVAADGSFSSPAIAPSQQWSATFVTTLSGFGQTQFGLGMLGYLKDQAQIAGGAIFQQNNPTLLLQSISNVATSPTTLPVPAQSATP